ncbi:hypothetical protein FJ444_14335 [Aestuariibacter sp. GS-14]|uniref:tyrosine-type recombinase/integrase n=1 Tax=Alteromonadaceae TaxID=72275 RepID=UPI00112E1AFA|nr:tyrosine-type recombinase/integrase [Aestuariibacter sp. GS-14]TPV56928.1 hypothetical protein FJ444_14335 [Aestuariibacter sp. GS-14]
MSIQPYPNQVSQEVIFADKQRLRDDLRTRHGLHGVITYLKLDYGQYHVLSRYEQDKWTLPGHWFPSAEREGQKTLNFGRINIPALRDAAKVVMARLLWGDDAKSGKRRGSTLKDKFNSITPWLNFLPSLGVTELSAVTPLVAMQYVTHVKSLISNHGRRKGKPLALTTICSRFLAVEACYQQLRETQYGFAHPWPESSAVALSGYKSHDKAKTEIIPDEVLAPLFQYGESKLNRAPELLRLQGLLSDFVPTNTLQRTQYLKQHGWASGAKAFNQNITALRDSCLFIILMTTGIRVHELCNLMRGNWYSEVRDGERFYFLGSRSEKTDAGNTHWLCPEITIEALRVLSDLMLPMQQLLEQQLDAAQQVGDAQEVARLTRRSNSVVLGKAPRQNNKIDVLSSTSINDRLQKLADSLGLDIKLASHRFRRTFASYVVHHKLGDLRYLRDHFKHWSLEMTVLYAMNEQQDLELYDEIYAAFDDERQGIIGHWLEPDTPLSGGLANQIRNLRDKATPTRTYQSRANMIRHISEQIYLRSTGLAWCTNDDGSCAGGRCEECEHGVIDDKKQAFWEGVYAQQIELKQIEGLGESGQRTVDKAIMRCEKVLMDLGADIDAIKKRANAND